MAHTSGPSANLTVSLQRHATMSKEPRTFGVNDSDQYWRDRKAAGRTSEKRVHHFIRAMVDECVPEPGKVLICGVGDGHEYRLCAERHQTWGVEMSRHAIEQYEFATDRIENADLNSGFPSFNSPFDAITVSMVLHWLTNPEQFLHEAKSLLSEGGSLVVVIPNITYYRHRLKFLLGHFPPISTSHKNFQTPAEVEDLFRRAGYRILKRAASKPALKCRLFPTLFATDLGYILQPS